MRIVGEIAHTAFKITIFKMDTRFSLKVENSKFEQTYKLRQVDTVDDVRKLVDEDFLAKAADIFSSMQENVTSALTKKIKPEEDEFEEII